MNRRANAVREANEANAIKARGTKTAAAIFGRAPLCIGEPKCTEFN